MPGGGGEWGEGGLPQLVTLYPQKQVFSYVVRDMLRVDEAFECNFQLASVIVFVD